MYDTEKKENIALICIETLENERYCLSGFHRWRKTRIFLEHDNGDDDGYRKCGTYQQITFSRAKSKIYACMHHYTRVFRNCEIRRVAPTQFFL